MGFQILVNKPHAVSAYELVFYFHGQMLQRYFLFFTIILFSNICKSQLQVQGRVFDVTKKTPLESVAVLTTNGRGAITDTTGRFIINVTETDTIYFSYQGKNTNRFAVNEIKDMTNFEVSIHVIANELPGVTVHTRNYKLDSIQNRKDYAKVFNFRKPTLKTATAISPLGVGIDLTELINMFRVKRNRQILSLQKRLIQQEEDKYIDRRFSKRFVIRLTSLKGAELDTFMNRYRPTYEFLQTMNDLELGNFIQKCFVHYQQTKDLHFTVPGEQIRTN